MRLLVAGSSGQVATALAGLAARDLEVVTLGRPRLDLAAPGDLAGLLTPLRPDVVVNAAAYTAVDRAESESDLAFAINAEGAGRLARAACDLGVPFIHFSTDYVFDGSANRPIDESAPTAPINAYGASKLAGEAAVREACPGAVILRTAWVYAPYGGNFLRTMLRLAETRAEIGVVADQFGTPTSALDIADAILAIARNLQAAPQAESRAGLFHLASAGGPVSWADFAQAIFARAADLGLPHARVKRIATADYPTPARRPAYSCLDTSRLARLHGVQLPSWQEGLARVMHELQGVHSA